MAKSLVSMGMPKQLYFMSQFVLFDKFIGDGFREKVSAELKARKIDLWFLEVIDFELLSEYLGKYRTLRDFLDSEPGYELVRGILLLAKNSKLNKRRQLEADEEQLNF